MIIKPEIDLLLSKVDSKYTLCIISSKRARQINDMVHNVRDQMLLAMAAMDTESVAELTKKKPLTTALEEIAKDEVGYVRDRESYK